MGRHHSENLFGSELGQELVIADAACELLVVTFDQSLQLLVRHVKAVAREEFPQLYRA